MDSWQSEKSWNVEYGPTGFTPGAGTLLTNLSTPTVTIPSLTFDLFYDIRVQAICGVSDLSVYNVSKQWTGYCIPETFDDGLSINSVSTANAITNVSNMSNGYAPNGYQLYASQKIRELVGGSFDITVTTSDGAGTSIWIDWNQNLVFDANELIYTTYSYMDDFTTTITVPAGTAIGDYRLRVLSDYYNDTPTDPCMYAYGTGETEEYTLSVINTPSCIPPSALAITNLTGSTASFNWVAGGSETAWTVEYGIAGFALGTGTVINATSNTVNITSLLPNTNYDFYVKAMCGATNVSFNNMIAAKTLLECGIIFTDNGGANGNYNDNENQSWTICAPNATSAVIVDFTSFELEPEYDFLSVYKGTNLFEEYTGNVIPATIISDGGGCLTFTFVSDNGGMAYPGWEASITCKNCVPSAGTNGAETVCSLDGSLDLNTVIQSSEEGTWKMNIMSSTVSESGDFEIEYLAPGIYHPYFVTGFEGIPGCSTDTVRATITIVGPSMSGTANALSTCNFGTVYLFNALSGNYDAGGNWFDSNNQPITGNTVVYNNQIPGNYNYTYKVSNGVCPEAVTTTAILVNQCASVDEVEENHFSVYPNPTSDDVYIQFDGVSSQVELLVVDVKGSIVARETVVFEQNSAHKVDLRNVESGIYFIQLNSSLLNTSFKVVKN